MTAKFKILPFELWFCFFPFAVYLADAEHAQAKEEPMTDDEVVVKTEGAHRLLLPKDWPVEEKDGRIGPVPIEEYLSMKFGQVKEKFSDTEHQIGALEQRLQQLEADHKVLQKRLRLLEERAHEQEVTHGDTTENP